MKKHTVKVVVELYYDVEGLPELLKEKVAELLNDINGIYCKSELPIGEHEGKLITISVYSNDYADSEEFDLEDKNTCLEVSE